MNIWSLWVYQQNNNKNFKLECKGSAKFKKSPYFLITPRRRPGHRCVLFTNVVKIYGKILVKTEQRLFWRNTINAVQRIFWRNTINASNKIYDFRTVTYGTIYTTFFVTGFLKDYLGKSIEFCNLLMILLIWCDFYVDNLPTGSDSYEEIN